MATISDWIIGSNPLYFLTGCERYDIISIMFEISNSRGLMYDTVKLLKALSNENRLAIFERLRDHELSCDGPDEGCSVGDIAQEFALTLSTVSHHLKELKEAGLIKCEQRGQYTYCHINEEAIKELRNYFSTDQ